ncbi:MAG: hypothetical protein ACFFD2_02595 [Promethearchaeota archaeon]
MSTSCRSYRRWVPSVRNAGRNLPARSHLRRGFGHIPRRFDITPLRIDLLEFINELELYEQLAVAVIRGFHTVISCPTLAILFSTSRQL